MVIDGSKRGQLLKFVPHACAIGGSSGVPARPQCGLTVMALGQGAALGGEFRARTPNLPAISCETVRAG